MKIAFLKGTDIADMMIKFWTMSKYSHCEMVFSDGHIIGSSTAPPFKVTKQYFNSQPVYPADWDVIEINVTPQEEALIRKFAEEQIGKAYDWSGIFFSQVIPIKVQDGSKWFCSELCVASMQVVPRLAALLKMKASTVSPGKFSQLIKKF